MNTEWTLTLTIDGTADAPVLVLGHALGASHVMWEEVLPELAHRFRIVRYDLPGHGRSRIAPVDEPLTLDMLFGALERSLNQAGIGRFHAAGLSMSGMLSLAMAARMPERVLSATTVSAGASFGPQHIWTERAARVREHGTGDLVDETIHRWFTPEYREGDGKKMVERIREEFIACEDEGYAQCCEVIGTTDLWNELDTITAPVHILNGTHDQGFDNAAAEALERALVNAESVLLTHIPGAQHMCAVEHPHVFASAV
ncbi:MAG: 3-oxoadipate enol-lactonase [Actinobacteria bacterium]|nr:MAG: 3-oxoadipate enol-lactonase [Actinomycetota bacterium]